MKNILLVSPDFDCESFWITDEEGTCAEVLNDMAPLGLATVAGMTPREEYQVDIWDEVVRGRITPETVLPRSYDLVGITGYNGHYLRCVEIARLFGERGILTAIGGPGVSGMAEKYRGHFDVLFVGEAEKTWPRFLEDWSRGSWKPEYRQIEKLDLAVSPLPDWSSISSSMSKYAYACVQTTRGCPFDCEFCDVIYLFGRRARHKPVEQVVSELIALEKLGATSVFFCDDEFIGDPKYTKALLRAIIPVNNAFRRPLSFSTQLTMNLSRDTELLELVADANFNVVFIGIETPNKESLRETKKLQNVRDDLVSDVRKILSYGIGVRAGLIVGFDHDDPSIFQTQWDFVHATSLPSVTLSMLKAIPGTRLWRRLRSEGRVLDITSVRGDSKHGSGFKPRSYTNVIPKSMTRLELMRGYRELAAKLYTWESFTERMCGFVSNVTRAPKVREEPLSAQERANLFAVGEGSEAATRAIETVVAHTEAVAPFMLRKVRTLTLQHANHVRTFLNLLPFIDRLVELEAKGSLSFVLDARPVTIPEAFRTSFSGDHRFFGAVHDRVYVNLRNKDHLMEALTEVFVDFLVRWGDAYEADEAQYAVYLEEITDRTCAKYNGEDPAAFAAVTPGIDCEAPDYRRSRLAEDILRSVEQELVRLNSSAPAEEATA